MKACELMIGDLIYVYGRNGNIFSKPHWYIRKVTADWLADMDIREANDKELTDNGIVIPNQLFIGDTKPIPLTDDILKANGFEDETSNFWKLRVDDKPHHYIFRLNKGGALGGDGYSMNCNIYTITINYVHELQHALRICGLNDLADNFKIE